VISDYAVQPVKYITSYLKGCLLMCSEILSWRAGYSRKNTHLFLVKDYL